MADKVDAVAKAMADTATESNASSDAKLVKDEETGEMVSKTVLKRRQKMRTAAAKKAEKKAAAYPSRKRPMTWAILIPIRYATGIIFFRLANLISTVLRNAKPTGSRMACRWQVQSVSAQIHTDFDPSSFHETYNHLKEGRNVEGQG